MRPNRFEQTLISSELYPSTNKWVAASGSDMWSTVTQGLLVVLFGYLF